MAAVTAKEAGTTVTAASTNAPAAKAAASTEVVVPEVDASKKRKLAAQEVADKEGTKRLKGVSAEVHKVRRRFALCFAVCVDLCFALCFAL